jgi:hypothetical protein
MAQQGYQVYALEICKAPPALTALVPPALPFLDFPGLFQEVRRLGLSLMLLYDINSRHRIKRVPLTNRIRPVNEFFKEMGMQSSSFVTIQIAQVVGVCPLRKLK